MHTGYWWRRLKERNTKEDLDIDGMITLSFRK
jgi:hypothetical protein